MPLNVSVGCWSGHGPSQGLGGAAAGRGTSSGTAHHNMAERSPEPKILQQLERLVRAWVSDSAGPRPTAAADCSLAQLVPYGSSALPGVARSDLGCDTDLDLLCLVPLPISRETHFFGLRGGEISPATSLAARLKAHPSVVGLVPVPPPAFVPCLKFVFAGIPVDLTFCALPAEVLRAPDFDPTRPHRSAQAALADDSPSARSLAAVHTTCHIRDAVPCAAVFGKLYVAVRLWAVRRGVHGKHLGFPCGVSWAVLCAAACQRSPADRSVSSLLRQFFDTYADWAWPSPVQLLANGGAADEQWCASPRDIMPIITPADVAADRMNSTHTVSPATFSMIQRELKRAARVLGEGGRQNWMAPVFESSDFWQQYDTFVSLDVRCSDEQAAGTDLDMAALELMPGSSRWLALCESLLRQWVTILESALGLPASSLHPYPIRLPSADSSSPCWSYMFGVHDWTGSITPSRQEKAGAEFRQMAVGRAGGEGEAWVTDAMTIGVRNFGQQDLPQWVPQPKSSDAADPDDGALFAYLSHASSQSAAEALAAQMRAETRLVSELEQQLRSLTQEGPERPRPDDASEVAVTELAADLGEERERAAILEAERDVLKNELKYMKERSAKALEDCKAQFKDERAKLVSARVSVEEDLKSVRAENKQLLRSNAAVANQQQQKQQQKQKQQAQHKLKNEQRQQQAAAAAAAAAQSEQSPVQQRGRKRQISIPISDVSEPDHTEAEQQVSPDPKPRRRHGKATLPEPEPEVVPGLELEANREPQRRNPKGQKKEKNKKGKAASAAASKLAAARTRANWTWSKRCHHSTCVPSGANNLLVLIRRLFGIFEMRRLRSVVCTLWVALACAAVLPALIKCGGADGHDHSGAGENYYEWTAEIASCSVEEAWASAQQWFEWPLAALSAALLLFLGVATLASVVPAEWAPRSLVAITMRNGVGKGQSFDGDGDI